MPPATGAFDGIWDATFSHEFIVGRDTTITLTIANNVIIKYVCNLDLDFLAVNKNSIEAENKLTGAAGIINTSISVAHEISKALKVNIIDLFKFQ